VKKTKAPSIGRNEGMTIFELEIYHPIWEAVSYAEVSLC